MTVKRLHEAGEAIGEIIRHAMLLYLGRLLGVCGGAGDLLCKKPGRPAGMDSVTQFAPILPT
jgi:hypothetical protein